MFPSQYLDQPIPLHFDVPEQPYFKPDATEIK